MGPGEDVGAVDGAGGEEEAVGQGEVLAQDVEVADLDPLVGVGWIDGPAHAGASRAAGGGEAVGYRQGGLTPHAEIRGLDCCLHGLQEQWALPR